MPRVQNLSTFVKINLLWPWPFFSLLAIGANDPTGAQPLQLVVGETRSLALAGCVVERSDPPIAQIQSRAHVTARYFPKQKRLELEGKRAGKSDLSLLHPACPHALRWTLTIRSIKGTQTARSPKVPVFSGQREEQMKKELRHLGHSHVECQKGEAGQKRLCALSAQDRLNSKLLRPIEQEFGVTFFQRSFHNPIQNFLLTVKILQFEKSNGELFSLGTNELNSQLSTLLHLNPTSLLLDRPVQLTQDQLQVSTIAEQEILLQQERTVEMELGAALPFHTLGEMPRAGEKERRGRIEWRFAGLKMKFLLKPAGRALVLDYDFELSRPQESGVEGNRESASLSIAPAHPYTLFQLGFYTQGNYLKTVPGINRIPFLWRLFAATRDQESYKKITALVEIRPYETAIPSSLGSTPTPTPAPIPTPPAPPTTLE